MAFIIRLNNNNFKLFLENMDTYENTSRIWNMDINFVWSSCKCWIFSCCTVFNLCERKVISKIGSSSQLMISFACSNM